MRSTDFYFRKSVTFNIMIISGNFYTLCEFYAMICMSHSNKELFISSYIINTFLLLYLFYCSMQKLHYDAK